ncbi:MAG: SUMF1/EgtB/PvdO family nonheme iron enzyme, partial [Gemmataceae bacterium]
MTSESDILQALIADSAASDGWMALGDWLEENGQLERAELVRLQFTLRQEKRWRPRNQLEKRVQELLAAGFLPPIPKIVNSVNMELALIPPGGFWMGSTRQQPCADHDEFPRHRVEVSRPYFLGIHQVTQEQYQAVMGQNPSHFSPDGDGKELVRHFDTRCWPVENVSYTLAREFCQRLSSRPEERQLGRTYRLPTEAEWEYACRACICTTAYHFSSKLRRTQARYGKMGGGHPVAVGSFRPNLFGLHDMHGNVWEWCQDWYDESYYEKTPLVDPTGPNAGQRRVLRGGGWSTPVDLCRSALRGHNLVSATHSYNGLRVVL